ncbi:hypothetical protein OG249_37830 [Streptomyces microflavus]|uniref:hypothetical protein n=1 Tax=Streptomyces microflavus TaxID=1919 RepID=UPI00225517FC|nr:hypothetical protein [Streptomyces microflavus]MCX4657619.1 hypothetical protein [Streptomyces microflavus]
MLYLWAGVANGHIDEVGMALLAAVGLLYVLVDRPCLREPLEAAATVMGAICTVGTLLWTVLEVRRSR